MTAAAWSEIWRMDDLGRLDTPMHRLDARAKALVTLAFVGVVMSFPRQAVAPLTPLLLYPMALLALGRISFRHIARKLLAAAPFALMVALFNPWLDRRPVADLGTLVLTGGWVSLGSILLRFFLTVSAALALVACTGMFRLGAGLERLGVPRLFVAQLLFFYRYLFVISDEGARMARAVAWRGQGTRALKLRGYASLVGQWLLRSMARAERVHQAMLSRGYDGTVRPWHRSRFRWADGCFACGWLAFFFAARRWDLANALGRLLAGGTP